MHINQLGCLAWMQLYLYNDNLQVKSVCYMCSYILSHKCIFALVGDLIMIDYMRTTIFLILS